MSRPDWSVRNSVDVPPKVVLLKCRSDQQSDGAFRMRFLRKLFINHPIKWGFCAFVGCLLLTAPLVQPTTCRDGWQSPSIGRRGACSWHGGVAPNYSQSFTLIASVIGGVAIGRFLANVRDRPKREAERKEREKRERSRAWLAERAAYRAKTARAANDLAKHEGGNCPKCGHPMRVRTARRGRYAGKRFKGCSRYPRCTGIRRLPDADGA